MILGETKTTGFVQQKNNLLTKLINKIKKESLKYINNTNMQMI